MAHASQRCRVVRVTTAGALRYAVRLYLLAARVTVADAIDRAANKLYRMAGDVPGIDLDELDRKTRGNAG